MKNIGEKIKELRKQKNLTLRELGEKINISYSNLSKIENGQYQPSINILQSLADLFGFDISYFFQEDNNHPISDFFKNFIQAKRLEKKYTIEQLAEMANINPELLTSIEKSNDIINHEVLLKLKNILDLPEDIIRIYSEAFPENTDNLSNSISTRTQENNIDMNCEDILKVPILTNYELLYHKYESASFKYISKADIGIGEYFYYVIPDDSLLNDRIYKGDYALIKRQSFVDEGKIAVFILNNEVMLRKAFYNNHHELAILASNDNSTSPLLINKHEIHFLGEIVRIEFSV